MHFGPDGRIIIGVMGTVKTNYQDDPVLRDFKASARRVLGSHLRELVLFGSRARGDETAQSDYDLLVVVDQVDEGVNRGIDEIAGQALLDHGAVLSAFSISETDRTQRKFSPLLLNIRREGVAI